MVLIIKTRIFYRISFIGFPLLQDISNLLKQNQIDAFSKLINVIEGTDLNFEKLDEGVIEV